MWQITVSEAGTADVVGRALEYLHRRQSLAVPTTLPGSWTSLGCYTDNVNGQRTISDASYTSGTNMTDESCINFCAASGWIYAGTEYASQCFCGNSLYINSSSAGLSSCAMACTGNPSEPCGGPNLLNLFYSNTPLPPGPEVNPGPLGWQSLGCYTDNTNGMRALTTVEATAGGSGKMTIAYCVSACQAAGFSLAGAEYGGECWCGNSFQNGGGPAPDGSSSCNMPCNGNSSEYCGGPNRLEAYKLVNNPVTTTTTTAVSATGTGAGTSATATGPSIVQTIGSYNFVGCYTEGTNARALSAKVVNTPDMNLQYCAGNCTGYTYFGAEYGTECYCGNSLAAGSVPATNQADCSFPCPGNSSEFCGAGNRLEMYRTNVTTPTSTATSGSPTAVGTGSATDLPAGWAYAGCYSEGSGGRALTGAQLPDSQTNTVEACVAACISAGYVAAGMEFSTQCFCGNSINNGGSLQPNSQCSMTCSGNSAEICGGPSLLSVYSSLTNGSLPVYGIPTVQTGGLPGSWTYKGCLQDNVNQQRTFPWQRILTTTNSAEGCLVGCAQFGYMAAGMEYGDECYCGDVSNIPVVGAQIVPDSQCNVPCSGNASAICGGGSLLSYYQWTGTPLYNWHAPTGTGMGQYELLIGGVCIPLMTFSGVNGKYSFVEKFGTGEPNSTGVYELDVASINNFTQAWRTLHVKTDVFCSAGFTLPDKVGRQINLGGWSGPSTYGIRLYWPDGSPGVPGVNDWHENVDELALQLGRWYPSTMVMTNGSILVVGGETGSNGPPVPSLELLPAVGPPITLPYLQSTDPFNLYPYLNVLPSGNILIIYYNQARILEPVGFNTVTQLPNLPGAVNDPTGGRTYPLEGTTMLLPQHAPYTDPMSVLVCGGSTPGPGYAIDNCVSTQPEAANPQWTIERMPSQRVMTCMTGLPDGTYMILNGAHHGVAGFGLATSPNLQAVMYDPTQPVGSRFSIMANTSVARLYHSEAILMQDGRVMVSGSDPQDGVNPEEYRVEVFIPPYLLSGLQQPLFTMSNKDWTYGEQISITVTTFNGGAVKVSIIGAATSTHGNSMGARTLFPASSCTGNTCTITAPPSGSVCPPGWYQVFVLEGPTPSHSIWVRIGGDPGKLGNWPHFSDFNVPGV